MDIAGFHLAVETYQKLGYLYRWDARGESFFDLMSFIDKINCFVNRDSLERSLDMDFSSIIGSFQKNKDARWYVEQDFGRIIVYGDRSIKITSTIIEQINQWLDYHLTLDYSSHSDGFERGWVRVEQYRSKWFVQEFSKSPMDYGIKKQNRK
jgi:hypothetical protein